MAREKQRSVFEIYLVRSSFMAHIKLIHVVLLFLAKFVAKISRVSPETPEFDFLRDWLFA